MSRSDGGPAFPVQDPQAIHDISFAAVSHIEDPHERDAAYVKARAQAVGGASLRDLFAMAALQGIMANPERWKQIAADYASGKKTYEQCSEANAVKAWSLADAMLEAREAQP